MQAPEADLSLLEAAAEEAGQIALSFWRKPFRSWDKPDGQGPVTEADLAVNEALRARLCPARPDYGWMSEEDADAPGRALSEALFVLDPIDGTRAFAAGEESFALSLAVVRAAAVVAGVVHLPAKGLTYTAHAGGAARLNGAALTPGRWQEGAGPPGVLTGKASLAPTFWPGGAPEVKRHFRPSIAYRLCLAAEGRFDAMLTFQPAWEWDIAAGSLIAARAGLVVTEARGGALSFNRPGRQNAGILAAPPALHADWIARMA